MAGKTWDHKGNNTVLLFGSQILSFDETSFRQLKASVSSDENHIWVLDALANLQEQWSTVCARFPKLLKIDGAELLRDLNTWFETGKLGQKYANSPLPNILLSPLVVITQLMEYAEYLKASQSTDIQQYADLYALPRPHTETLGLCTGMLSAMVVSSSTNKIQFAKHGAIAIRLAMLTGAFVDAQDAHDENGESKSLAAVWKSPESSLDIQRILQNFPEVACP
jgi:hypothetical protein